MFFRRTFSISPPDNHVSALQGRSLSWRIWLWSSRLFHPVQQRHSEYGGSDFRHAGLFASSFSSLVPSDSPALRITVRCNMRDMVGYVAQRFWRRFQPWASAAGIFRTAIGLRCEFAISSVSLRSTAWDSGRLVVSQKRHTNIFRQNRRLNWILALAG